MPIKGKNETNAQNVMTEKSNEVLHFEKLAPTNNANIDIYEDAINFVFNNPDLKNIAISGAYGSGKSSMLASYKKKYPNKKFIHISLAHFEPNSVEKASKEKHAETFTAKDKEDTSLTTEDNAKNKCIQSSRESILEGKILNQLIHQIEEKDIPQTNFRIKNSLTPKQIYRVC